MSQTTTPQRPRLGAPNHPTYGKKIHVVNDNYGILGDLVNDFQMPWALIKPGQDPTYHLTHDAAITAATGSEPTA